MPTDEGWIKLHRKILNSPVSKDPHTGHIWVQLLLRANWDRRQLLDGQWLEPGELIISQSRFAAEVGSTRQILRRVLENLRKCQNLTIKPTKRGTHITICNWRTYQDTESAANQQTNQQPTNSQPTTNQQPTIEEEVKEVKKVKKREGGCAPPRVSDVAAYCREKGYNVDAEKFVNYYEARGWRLRGGLPVRSWKACCTTWHKRASEFESNGKAGSMAHVFKALDA